MLGGLMPDAAERTCIEVNAEPCGERIAPELFGLHVEHIWNCVYPAIWVGPESEVPNVWGLREEVVHRLADIRPTVCKYPGGYFSDYYDWRDGVGPRRERPVRVCPTQPGRVECNHFGTAEFVRFCRLIGAEPFLSVNTTSIEANVAAHWVEYCNGTENTYWAQRRREDGYEKPFNVRYWAIGNEPYWRHSAEEYAERYRRWTHWMYNTDPTVTIVAGGVEPGQCVAEPWNTDGRWDERFCSATRAASGLVGCRWHPRPEDRRILYSFHPYFEAQPDCTPEQYYAALAQLHRRMTVSIAEAVDLLDRTRGEYPRPRLCFDEYGLLFPGWRMDGNMTQPAPFWSALWLAAFFQNCFEHGDRVAMANLPGTVNMEHELLLLEAGQVVATPSYYVFKLFREHGGADRLRCTLTNAPSCSQLGQCPLLCYASLKPDGRTVTLSVVNLDLSLGVRARVKFLGRPVGDITSTMLACSDIHACNSADEPGRVVPTQRPVLFREGVVEHELPTHSVTVFEARMMHG